MKARSGLSLLIELRRMERDRVAGVAARGQRDVDSAQNTLQMLHNYKADYERRSPKSEQAATDALRVRVHEAFVGKLGGAIGEQDALLAHLRQRRDEQRAALAEGERRLRALETLAARREAEERKRLERIEQKQTDEFASQAYRRNTKQGNHHDR